MRIKKLTMQDEALEITEATLLTAEEAETLPHRLREYEYWWWLRSSGDTQYAAALVYSYGSVNYYGISVYGDGVYVRPALKIQNLESSNLAVGDTFIFHDKIFEVINKTTAFCTEDIGTYCFRKGWKAIDANDYETSDVKKYVDNWFSEATE